jgi:hypothetical protein
VKTYPIHVARSNYRGADTKKRAKASAYNRDAATLEAHVNELLKAQIAPVQVYLWMELAQATGLSYDRVAELGFSIDGGHNGFTAFRHDMGYEAAMEAIHRRAGPTDETSDH